MRKSNKEGNNQYLTNIRKSEKEKIEKKTNIKDITQ